MKTPTISIVTPTFRRPREVKELLENISLQSLLPTEVVLVDGLIESDSETEKIVDGIKTNLPFSLNYIRHRGGTATQRNAGIEAAKGEFVAFIDDDVRLEKHFLLNLMNVFAADTAKKVGGVVGYRTNRHFSLEESQRWRWYRRLSLLSIYEPGRYDFECGYPINNNLQPPFGGTRSVDFMTTACAMWRKEVFDSGLRFHQFFQDYGVLEDAHLSLKAGLDWILLQCGDAHCEEMNSPNGRTERRKIGYKCVVNYYFVFRDIVKPLTFAHKFRFWRFQAFEIFRIAVSAVRRRNWDDIRDVRGRIEGVVQILRGLERSPENH